MSGTPHHDMLGLGQVAITVDNLERAVEFYRDVLGLPFLFSAPPSLAFFRIGTTRLMLTRPEGTDKVANSVLYYKVSDLQSSFDSLQGRATFVDEPHLIAEMGDHDLWMVFLRDPDDNLIGLMEERSCPRVIPTQA